MPIVDVSDIDAMHLHNVDDSGIENWSEQNQDSQDVLDDQDKIISTTFNLRSALSLTVQTNTILFFIEENLYPRNIYT